ncbi:guanine-specific ribonuclease N1 and T1 [Calidifontibacter sp. DB0510]|uniref:Guanine-specific ribonuclease N1 and T1 n=2 Tax=Metallococcus carri TaxID=1656884 RepID=A0A967B0I6_9MICO|nr:guanine-specific ribonuclease N1 and T1 [Metallococcus carri]NOP38848.1 guanine-specific ribonuclease N1 and T1 [Calidifontibacter sp. DB2511S]
MAIGVAVLALILCLVLLAGCGTATPTTPARTGTTGATDTTSDTTSTGPTASTASDTPSDGLATVAFDDLPREARDTIALIDRGGPYPYKQDGAVFGNFEQVLPKRPRGYYHEFTVRTPGERTRGARRIVQGKDGTLYYTDDHYTTFRRILR